MKHLRCVLLLSLLPLAAIAQQAREKTLVYNTAPALYSDGLHQKIYALHGLYTDSVSDIALLNATDSADWKLRLPMLYALSEKDSTRYIATVVNNYTASRYIVNRFDRNGYYTRIARYDRNKRLDGLYSEYYTGMRMKTLGRYRSGERSGKWRYFDVEGNLLKKEKYRSGTLVRAKDYAHPRRRWVTILGPKYYEPVPYEILDPQDTVLATFASDTIPRKHSPVGISAVFGFMQQDFGNVREQLPWMLDRPKDYCLVFGTELHVGVREFLYVTGSMAFSADGVRGFYENYDNVSVTTISLRTGVRVNVAILQTKRSMLHLSGGLDWAMTSLESAWYVPDTVGNTIWFERSTVRQNAIHLGLEYSFSRKPNVPNWMSCVSLRAGYSIPFDICTWNSVPAPVAGKPFVNYRGLTFGLALTNWKVKPRKKGSP